MSLQTQMDNGWVVNQTITDELRSGLGSRIPYTILPEVIESVHGLTRGETEFAWYFERGENSFGNAVSVEEDPVLDLAQVGDLLLRDVGTVCLIWGFTIPTAQSERAVVNMVARTMSDELKQAWLENLYGVLISNERSGPAGYSLGDFARASQRALASQPKHKEDGSDEAR